MDEWLHPPNKWDAITHLCPNFTVEVIAWMSDYIRQKTMDEITYPYPIPVNLYSKKILGAPFINMD